MAYSAQNKPLLLNGVVEIDALCTKLPPRCPWTGNLLLRSREKSAGSVIEFNRKFQLFQGLQLRPYG